MTSLARHALAVLFATAFPALSVQAAGRLSGAAMPLDALHLRLGSHVVKLAGIAAPALDAKCLWKGKTRLPCGRMARAALRDLTAGATVVCHHDTALRGFRCRAAGYDLAEGLVHAGWAIPLPGAPTRWFAEKRRARARQLMLWRARTFDGRPFMATLGPVDVRQDTPVSAQDPEGTPQSGKPQHPLAQSGTETR